MVLWKRLGLVALAGGAAVSGMAPFNLWPVLILALAVLGWAVEGAQGMPRPVRTAMLTGWAFGLTYFAGGLYWIGEAFYVDPNTIWMMPIAMTLMPAGMALFFAVPAALTAFMRARGPAFALIFASVFCATEYLRGFIFTGFPWNLFGSTFIDSAAAQGAALVGVYGLTLIALLCGFALPPLLGRGRWRALPAALGAALLAVMFGYGFMRPDAPPSAGPLQVRVVQPDAPQSEKMSGDYARRLWLRLLDISFAPGADQAQVIIWPEGVLPFLDEAPEALAILSARMAKGQFVLAGSARRAVSDDGRMRFYNALLAIGSDGRVAAIYDKAHLVPFGEYLPFPAFFESLGIGSLNARVANAFSQGPGLQTLSLSGLPPFGPLICYEALFPAAVVAGGAPRPGWLVNVTDDSWFGTGTGPWQHLAAVRFRAIEEGLPIVRSATTGISSVIDARGRILAFLPLSQSGSLDVSLTPGSGSTLFSQHGHVSVLVLTLMLLAVGFALKNKD